MRERKQHVKLGKERKERKEKRFLLACFSSEHRDLSAFCIKVGRDGARMGSGCQRVQAGWHGVPAARGGNPAGLGTGLLLPGGMNGPDLCRLLSAAAPGGGKVGLHGTGTQLQRALAPISRRGANHLLGIWPSALNELEYVLL